MFSDGEVPMRDETFTGQPRLLLVDDHTTVRAGLTRIIEDSDEGWGISEACSGHQALERLRNGRYKLAIVDLSMPGMSGLDLIRRIRAEFPEMRILVLSMHAEEQYAMRAFTAGANGYMTKDTAADELLNAIQKVSGGGSYVTGSLAERVIQQLNGKVGVAPHAKLSNRELEVLRRIAGGQRITDIAEALHLSVKTVSTHKSRILDKLNLDTTAALIRYGMENQLTDDAPQPSLPADHGA